MWFGFEQIYVALFWTWVPDTVEFLKYVYGYTPPNLQVCVLSTASCDIIIESALSQTQWSTYYTPWLCGTDRCSVGSENNPSAK